MKPKPGRVPRYLDTAIVRQAAAVAKSAERHRLLVEAYSSLLAQREAIVRTAEGSAATRAGVPTTEGEED